MNNYHHDEPQQQFFNSIPEDDATTSEEEETETDDYHSIVVHLQLDDCFGSTLLTNFYRTNQFSKINSTIIIEDNIALCNEIMYHTKSISIPQLLYRGTRDGFRGEDFHFRCDNQGPTLTLIKSANEPINQIFGGFTTQNWKSPSLFHSAEYISDSSAFIFKIENDSNNTLSGGRVGRNGQKLFRKFNIKQDRKQNAIYLVANYLPIFGGGCDFLIYADCHLNTNSRSNFGHTYELPPTNESELGELVVEYDTEQAKSYLAGSKNFKVLEIEVFKIIVQ